MFGNSSKDWSICVNLGVFCVNVKHKTVYVNVFGINSIIKAELFGILNVLTYYGKILFAIRKCSNANAGCNKKNKRKCQHYDF